MMDWPLKTISQHDVYSKLQKYPIVSSKLEWHSLNTKYHLQTNEERADSKNGLKIAGTN
jgi:hypothetical protein